MLYHISKQYHVYKYIKLVQKGRSEEGVWVSQRKLTCSHNLII